MMRLIFALVAVVLASCSSGLRTPDWQLQARVSAERFIADYLSASPSADAQWHRIRLALASTAQPARMARAELLRCALRVASLDWQPRCEGFEVLRDAASPAELAYADYLQGRWNEASRSALSPVQRRVTEQGPRALAGLEDPLSRLLGAAVLMRSGQVPPSGQDALVAVAVDTASAQGWRRPLLAWLGLQRDRLQAQGRSAEADRVMQRLKLLESP